MIHRATPSRIQQPKALGNHEDKLILFLLSIKGKVIRTWGKGREYTGETKGAV